MGTPKESLRNPLRCLRNSSGISIVGIPRNPLGISWESLGIPTVGNPRNPYGIPKESIGNPTVGTPKESLKESPKMPKESTRNP